MEHFVPESQAVHDSNALLMSDDSECKTLEPPYWNSCNDLNASNNNNKNRMWIRSGFHSFYYYMEIKIDYTYLVLTFAHLLIHVTSIFRSFTYLGRKNIKAIDDHVHYIAFGLTHENIRFRKGTLVCARCKLLRIGYPVKLHAGICAWQSGVRTCIAHRLAFTIHKWFDEIIQTRVVQSNRWFRQQCISGEGKCTTPSPLFWIIFDWKIIHR